MRTKQIAITLFALWLVIISLFMLFAGWFDAGLFFVMGFIGFLVIIELTALHYVKPAYLRYIRYLIAAGIVICGVIVVQKMMEVLGLYFTWSF